MSIISMIDEVYRVESLHVMMVADARVGEAGDGPLPGIEFYTKHDRINQ